MGLAVLHRQPSMPLETAWAQLLTLWERAWVPQPILWGRWLMPQSVPLMGSCIRRNKRKKIPLSCPHDIAQICNAKACFFSQSRS